MNRCRTNWLNLSISAVLLAVGLTHVVGVSALTRTLDQPDPVMGMKIRLVMFLIGGLSLTGAAFCLFSRDRKLASLLAAWMGLTFLTYRVGLWTLGGQRSCGFVSAPLGLSSSAMDAIFIGSALILLTNGTAVLWLKYRLDRAAKFLKMSCPGCGTHIKFFSQNVGQKFFCSECGTAIKLRKSGEIVKISCFFCHGHIELPAHAIGQKMACPHCKMDIILKEPV